MDAADVAEAQFERDVARMAGIRARKNGVTRNACPHDADEPMGAAWLSGWDQEDDRRRVSA